jgi:E3 ubiquitin-protein ligase RNF146
MPYHVADLQDNPDCAVCLQPSLHPVQLPCSHIFCFLCVKGAASRNRRCALCRQEIPPDFFTRPNLLRSDDGHVVFDEGYQWYYEGVNGWWQYDARTSVDLEAHHKKGDRTCELLIAGFLYVIDFENMVQHRHNDRTKKRRIKRDLINIPGKKGVAGLKIGVSPNANSSGASDETDRPSADGTDGVSPGSGHVTQGPIPITQIDRTGNDHSFSPPTPYNTPLTPQTPSESPPTHATTERDLSIHLERLRLADSHSYPLSEENSSGEDVDSSVADSSSSQPTPTRRRQRGSQGVVDSHAQDLASAIYDQMASLGDRAQDDHNTGPVDV